MKLLSYVIPFLFYVTDTYSPKECHSGISDIKYYFGSKTPYRFVANTNYRLYPFKGCKREKIIGFIRHGTRSPSMRIMMRMKHDLPMMRDYFVHNLALKSGPGLLCNSVVKELALWQYRMEHSEELGDKILGSEGQAEMKSLALRLQDVFPDLLPQECFPSWYNFKFVTSQRAASSARFFVSGLLEDWNQGMPFMFPSIEQQDIVLNFDKNCPKWIKTIKESSEALDEYWSFYFGDEITKLCESVSRKLGVDVTMAYGDVYLMYSACRHETAYQNQISPWCLLFDENEFKTLEYADDLKYYWRESYGHKLNYEIACPAVKHIFDYLKSNNTADATANFYFTHSGTIMKLLSHLGLYKDPFNLTESLPKVLRDERLFRTSYINPFGSNIIFIAYKCGDEKKILTLHQERPVQIPGCPGDGQLCPLSFLLDKFKDSINHCNFSEMCYMPPATDAQTQQLPREEESNNFINITNSNPEKKKIVTNI